jgi:hypothetical protein
MKRISTNKIGVIIGLVISVLWIFMGLDSGFKYGSGFDNVSYILTLGGYRHTVMSVSALFLIPVCAREYRWGFLAAMLLGIVTLTLALTHVIYMMIAASAGYRSLMFGPIVWSIMQIPIVMFGYRARIEADEEAGARNGPA